MREALAREGMARLVEPFDPARYNHQADIGENILFGEAVSPAFSQARLAAHPYLRAVLEAEDLTRTLVDVGLQVARSTVEIFADHDFLSRSEPEARGARGRGQVRLVRIRAFGERVQCDRPRGARDGLATGSDASGARRHHCNATETESPCSA